MGFRWARERRNDERCINSMAESSREFLLSVSDDDTLVGLDLNLLVLVDLDDLGILAICSASLSMCRIKTQAAATTNARNAAAPPIMPPSCVDERLSWLSLPLLSVSAAEDAVSGAEVVEVPVSACLASSPFTRPLNLPRRVGISAFLALTVIVVNVAVVMAVVIVAAAGCVD